MDALMDDIVAAVALHHEGKADEARRRLAELWEVATATGDGFHRCTLAHYMADLQEDPRQELLWDFRALEAANTLTEEQVRAHQPAMSLAGLFPSLHLNLAEDYRKLGDLREAREHINLAREALPALSDDGYGRMIRGGIERLMGALLDTDPVVVVPYDPTWPAAFAAERDRILAAVPANGAEIHHIGSTAVPGLAAKPVIDLMIGVAGLDDAPRWIHGLQALGYEYLPRYETEMPERRYFRRFVDGVRTSQIHLVDLESQFIWRHVVFRNYLREFPAEAEAYGQLKTELAMRFRDDRDAYMDGKDAFIKAMERRAFDWDRAMEGR